MALRGYTGIGKFREMFIGRLLIQLQTEPILSPVQNTSVAPKSLVSLVGETLSLWYQTEISTTKLKPARCGSSQGTHVGGSVENLSWAVVECQLGRDGGRGRRGQCWTPVGNAGVATPLSGVLSTTC